MYNLSLPNLCAMHSSLRVLRLPPVDPYSAVGPGEMHPTLYCVMAYIAACVDASRTVLLGPFIRYVVDSWIEYIIRVKAVST